MNATIKGYNFPQLTTFLARGVEAESKEQYIAWVREWKTLYRELSMDIRGVKGMRKQNAYTYRDPKDDTAKRRTVSGPNPRYEAGSTMRAYNLKDTANAMLRGRTTAKAASWERKLAADQLLAA